MKYLNILIALFLSFSMGTAFAQSDTTEVKIASADSLEILTSASDSLRLETVLPDSVKVETTKPENLSTEDSNSKTTSKKSSTKPAKKWKFKGKPGMNFSQNGFSNWTAGGISTLTLEFDSEFGAYYKVDDKEWKTDLRMQWGINRNSGEGSRKMIDKIDFQSFYSFEGPNEQFKYSILFNLKSQFTEGYHYNNPSQWYLNSGFFAPGYINFDFGIDYIGTENLIVHLSPLYEKTTVVREQYYNRKVENVYHDGYEPQFHEDEEFQPPPPTQAELDLVEATLIGTETTYGLEWRDNMRFEIGSYVQIAYDHPGIIKNIDFKSRIDLFESYTNFGIPDMDAEVWLAYNLNKYIALKVNFQLLYDSDILVDELDDFGFPTGNKTAKLQFRNFFGLGLAYKFQDK